MKYSGDNSSDACGYLHAQKTLGHIVLVFKVALSRTCILLNVGQVVGNVTRDPQNYILIYDFLIVKKNL